MRQEGTIDPEATMEVCSLLLQRVSSKERRDSRRWKTRSAAADRFDGCSQMADYNRRSQSNHLRKGSDVA